MRGQLEQQWSRTGPRRLKTLFFYLPFLLFFMLPILCYIVDDQMHEAPKVDLGGLRHDERSALISHVGGRRGMKYNPSGKLQQMPEVIHPCMSSDGSDPCLGQGTGMTARALWGAEPVGYYGSTGDGAAIDVRTDPTWVPCGSLSFRPTVVESSASSKQLQQQQQQQQQSKQSKQYSQSNQPDWSEQPGQSNQPDQRLQCNQSSQPGCNGQEVYWGQGSQPHHSTQQRQKRRHTSMDS